MTETRNEQINGVFFLAKPCLQSHLHLLSTSQADYLAALQNICKTGVVATLSQPTKARILAALQTCSCTTLVSGFMRHCDVVEVAKACQILDRPRKIKQLQKKIAVIENAHPHLVEEEEKNEESNTDKLPSGRRSKRHKKGSAIECEVHRKRRARRIDALRAELKREEILLKGTHDVGLAEAHSNTATQEMIDSASLSGSFAKKVRCWAESLKEDFLEFIVMTGAFEYWRQLADLVHFHPNDFSLKGFLAVVHGGPLPEGSFVKRMADLTKASEASLSTKFGELAKSHPQVYQAFNFLRTQGKLLRNKEIVSLLASNIPLNTAVWYMEELAASNKDVPSIVASRLEDKAWMDKGTKVSESFGKLLERILTFRKMKWDGVANQLMPAAGQRLAGLRESWAGHDEGFTVVLGDKSSSMTTAIQASTILAAMISACFPGELCFFDHQYRPSPHAKPSTVEHVLKICQQIRASGGTSLAAALYPYYEKKVKIDRIILVSDEEENTPWNGHMFAKLLRMYKDEVHDGVELIIICVDQGDSEFRRSLERNSIDCQRMEIDGIRPDLSKFDAMISQIALLSKTKKIDNAQQGRAAADDFVLIDGDNHFYQSDSSDDV